MSSDQRTVFELMAKIDEAGEKYFVGEFETGYISLSSKRQYFKGYCFFTSKLAVNELHFMPPDFRQKHLFEMTIVAEAVQNAFGASKMNVAYLGNSLPHVHWNIIPRYGTDPLPRDAIWSIDRQLIESVVLDDDELQSVKRTLVRELQRQAALNGIGAKFPSAFES
jgi:diadenosine tetraphosphate (Ap4A) HIT family hydrolase